MLPHRLTEVRDRINSKPSYIRTSEEKELLEELGVIDKLVEQKGLSRELKESIKGHTLITSGPGGNCPCCGK